METYSKQKILVLYSFMFLISNIVLLLYPLLIAKIVNIIQLEGLNNQTFQKLLLWLSGYLILELAFWIMHGPARWLESINAFKVKASYKMHLLKGVMKLPSSWHADHESGNTIDKIEKGSKALYDFTESSFLVIASVSRIIGATIALFLFDISAGFVTVGIIMITIVTVIKFDKVLIPKLKKLNILDNEISAKVYDTVSNITTVIILRLENMVTKSLHLRIMHPLPLFKKSIEQKEYKWFAVSTIIACMFILNMGLYIWGHLKTGEVILIGSLMALFQYISNIENIFYSFTYHYGQIVQQKTDVENAEIIANDITKHKRSQKNQEVNQIDLKKKSWQSLHVDKLKFFYSQEDQAKDNPTLSINYLTIKKGEKIALVGESGAGKTTFLKLLRDLYTPQLLKLKLENKNNEEQTIKYGFKQIANSISLIPQDPEIFAGTIQDNITFGIRTTKATIKQFTDLARFTTVIPTLPQGLKSKINEKGVNLSGGQKQRLALARGLLASKSKEIVLLDEPTSSVDAHNELRIYQDVLKTFKDKTIISSLHRLHLLPYFDRIFYFENGKIMQTGTLAELLRTNKKFKRLWDKYKAIE